MSVALGLLEEHMAGCMIDPAKAADAIARLVRS